MEPEYLRSLNKYFWSTCSMSGTVLDAGDIHTLTLPLWKSYTSSSEIYWKIVLQQLVGWITLSDTAVLSAHPSLRCSRERYERESQPEASWGKNCLKQLKKIYRVAPVSPASLPSRKTILNWREQMLRTPKKCCYLSLSNSPGRYCSPVQNHKSGEVGLAIAPIFTSQSISQTLCALKLS